MVINVSPASLAKRLYSGKIVAENVSYEDFLTGKYGTHVEWVNGMVIEMPSVGFTQNRLNKFLIILLQTYCELTDGGVVTYDPFVMKSRDDLPGRQPDVQIILPNRLHLLKENEMAGPANLVIEIVSPESGARDRGEKRDEYEQGGVQEYWILDPQRRESLFYVRGEDELFHLRLPVDGVYTSSVLPKLKFKVDILWRENLPTTIEIVQMVDAMLKDETI
jgi:Uma2 family endonuclease